MENRLNRRVVFMGIPPRAGAGLNCIITAGLLSGSMGSIG
jgi:hypothetical protein